MSCHSRSSLSLWCARVIEAAFVGLIKLKSVAAAAAFVGCTINYTARRGAYSAYLEGANTRPRTDGRTEGRTDGGTDGRGGRSTRAGECQSNAEASCVFAAAVNLVHVITLNLSIGWSTYVKAPCSGLCVRARRI